MVNRTILIVEHDREHSPAYLSDYLARAGFTTISVLASTAHQLPGLELMSELAGVVLLDSNHNALIPTPVRAARIEWVRNLLARDIAIFALGYGAQIVTLTLGGTVQASPATRGWFALDGSGASTLWRERLDDAPHALRCHDALCVPASLALALFGDRHGQAFAYAKRNIVLVEILIELTPALYRDRLQQWRAAGQPATSAIQTLDELEHRGPELLATSRRLAEQLLDDWMIFLPDP